MKRLFALEVTASDMTGVITGDEVIVDPLEMPVGNGRDLAAFNAQGEYFISRFTRFGNQIILLPENGPIRVIRAASVDIVGKVVGGSIEMDTRKAPAVTGAQNALSLYA